MGLPSKILGVDTFTVALYGVAVGVITFGAFSWYEKAKKEGAQEQFAKDAPVIAETKGDALVGTAEAAIAKGTIKAGSRASTTIDTIRAQEASNVSRIQAAGGVSDDDWRSAILGMRRDRTEPLDSIPEDHQREPASAPSGGPR